MATNQDTFKLTGRAVAVTDLLLLLFLVYATHFYNYILFHSVAEAAGIAVSFAIAVVIWNTRHYINNGYFILVGIAFFFIAPLDLFHALAYKGMNIFPSSQEANLATQLWLGGRYVQAATFLLAPAFINRKVPDKIVFYGYAIVTALIFYSIFWWRIAPDAYLSGVGLTSFKITSEILIILAFLGSSWLLYRKRSQFDRRVYQLLIWSLAFTILSESLFTQYAAVYDYINLTGHLLRIVSFYFIYLALIETGLQKPFRFLYKKLAESNQAQLQSEERFRAIFDNAAVGIILADMTGRAVETNEKFRQMIGYSAQELAHMEIEDFTHTDDIQLDLSEFREMKQGLCDSYYLEKRYVKKDGEVLWVDVNVSLIRDAKDVPKYTLGVISNVTKRKLSDQALAHSRAELQTIFNSIKDGIVFANTDRKFAIINPAIEKMFGYTKAELIGQSTEIFYADPKDFEALGKNIYQTEHLAEKRPYEILYRRKDGSVFPAESISSQVVDESGKIMGYIDIHRDVSERKQNEEKIRHLASFPELNPQPVIEADESGRIIYVNPSANNCLRLLGGRSDARRLLPADLDHIIKLLHDSTVSDTVYREVEVGDLVFAEDILLAKDRKTVRFYLKDITQRKRAEEALAKRHNELAKLTIDLEKFELAVQNASDLILITDPEGKIIFANTASKEVWGYEPTEIVGTDLNHWRRRTGEQSFNELWQTLKAEKRIVWGETIILKKDGRPFIAEAHISPAFGRAGKIIHYVCILRDVTRAKEIDRAKTEFVSLASHQLRTPLSSISLSAELLLRGVGGPVEEKQRKYLKEIYQSTKRMTELISALLNISRLELGTFVIKPEPMDLARNIDLALNEMKLQLSSKKIKLTKTYGKLPIIQFDPNILHVILDNLLTNALRYTPPGGRISVRIEDNAGEIILTVADSGCGIPPEAQDRIFEKLFRAENAKEVSAEGAGLGLYLVKSVAEKIGARVWFESKVNQGTSFYVSIPIKHEVLL